MGAKIRYKSKRSYSQAASRNQKRVHLLFDEDGNAVDAETGESAVSLPQPVESDAADQKTSAGCLDTSSDAAEPTSNGCEIISVAGVADPVISCSPLLMADNSSDSLEDAEEGGAWSENCIDRVNRNTDGVCDDDEIVMTENSVSSSAASSDPEISKYWWQRYRLFSRFDSGIMIDRGW